MGLEQLEVVVEDIADIDVDVGHVAFHIFPVLREEQRLDRVRRILPLEGRQRRLEERLAHDLVGVGVILVHAAVPVGQDDRRPVFADQVGHQPGRLLVDRQLAIAVGQQLEVRPDERGGGPGILKPHLEVFLGGERRVAFLARGGRHDGHIPAGPLMLEHQRPGHVLRVRDVPANNHQVILGHRSSSLQAEDHRSLCSTANSRRRLKPASEYSRAASSPVHRKYAK